MSESTIDALRTDPETVSESGHARVLQHGIWAIAGKIATSFTSLLMTSGIARLLSPEDFGSFSLFRNLNMVLGLACTFGLGTAALRALSHVDDRSPAKMRPQIIRDTLLLNAAVSIVFGLLGFAFCYLFSDRVLHLKMSLVLAVAIALSSVGFGLIQTVSDLLRGCGDLRGSNLIGGQRGVPIAMLAAVIVAFFSSAIGYASWQLFVYYYLFGIVLSMVAAFYLLVRAIKEPHPLATTKKTTTDTDHVNSSEALFSVAWPLAAVSLLSFFGSQGDQFLTGMLSIESDATPYLAARRVIAVLVLPLGVLNLTVRGLIAPLYNRRETANLQRILQGGTILAAFPSVVVGVLCLFVPRTVLWVVLGPGYEDASLFLQILIPGEIIMVITGSCGLLLSLTGFHRIVMWINVLMAILLLILGPLSAMYFSGWGLAMLTSALIGVQNIIMWFVAWKLTGINTFCRPSFRHLKEVISVFRGRKKLVSKTTTT